MSQSKTFDPKPTSQKQFAAERALELFNSAESYATLPAMQDGPPSAKAQLRMIQGLVELTEAVAALHIEVERMRDK